MLRPRPKRYCTLGVARRKWRRPRPNTSYVNWTTIHNILGRYSLNDPSPSSDLAAPPVARPVDSVVLTSDVVPLARPLSSAVVTGPPALPEEVRYVVVKHKTEPFAVASAICGIYPRPDCPLRQASRPTLRFNKLSRRVCRRNRGSCRFALESSEPAAGDRASDNTWQVT